MNSPPRETLSRLITSASLRLLSIIPQKIFNAIGLGRFALDLMSSLAGVKRPLLDCGEGGHDSQQRRLTYLDSLVCESEKRYMQTWQLLYVEDRLSHLREILAMLQNDHHQHPKNEEVAANLLMKSSPGTATHFWRRAVQSVDDSKDALYILNSYRVKLARALGDKFIHIRHVDDVECQIQLCLSILDSPARPSDHTEARCTLAVGLRARFERLGDLDDINSSVDYLRQALQDTGSTSAECPWYETELGRSLMRRFQRSSNRSDLAEALSFQRHAIEVVPFDHPYRDQLLYNVGNTLWVGCRASGETSMLQESIAYLRLSLEIRGPSHRDRHKSLNGLEIAFRLLFELTTNPDHLDAAIQAHEQSLELRPIGHPDRSQSLTNLSSVFETRYEVFGATEDLADAIGHGRESLALQPYEHAHRCNTLMSLAIPLCHIAIRNGDLNDLEESIKLVRECLQLTSPGHHWRCISLLNLGETLLTRFTILGQDVDLEEALEITRESLSFFPDEHPNHSMALFNLVNILEKRFQVSGSTQDLVEAIGLHKPWFEQTENETNSLQVEFAVVAARTYRSYFQSSGNVESLENAVKLYSMAVQLCGDRHPQKYMTLHELAATLRIRYLLLKNWVDVEKAVDLQNKALESLPLDHADRAQILCGKTHLYLIDGTPYFDPYRAAEILSEALLDTRRSARLRLSDAVEVLEAFERLSPDVKETPNLRSRMLQAYRLAVSLLPQVAYFGLDMRSRLRVLEKGDGLATTAALHALMQVQTDQAIEILEEGRAVFWTQYLRLRTPLDALPNNLREELTMASRQLELGPLLGSTREGSDCSKARMEEEVTRQRRLCERFEVLVNDVRALSGFERFMLHDTFAALSVAAEKGPVVVLVASSMASYAIIIRSNVGSAEQVLLPGMVGEHLARLNEQLRDSKKYCRGLSEGRSMKQIMSRGRRARNILEDIWVNAVRVIIVALEARVFSGHRRGRLWICPTGPFVHFPIHASGVYAHDGTECLSDYFVTSYTPTLGALIHARANLKAPSRTNLKVLLAAVSKPFKWKSLPHADSEIASIREVIPTGVVADAAPAGDSASAASVLEKVPGASILHLACHGYHSSGNPLESGFVMRDEMLTMSKLMALNLPDTFLAFLSACATAKGDDKQPDQAINLASTMLFAGFKSVVGTMWSMEDIDGPIVAKRVYEELFRGNGESLDPDTIPYALDEAMHDLRKQGLHLSRWAPYVHLGV